MRKDTAFVIRVPQKIHAKIKRVAQREKVSMAEFIRQAVLVKLGSK